MSRPVAVQAGDQVFGSEGGSAFGAVRYVHPDELIISVEGFGETSVPADAVVSVHDEKVIVNPAKLTKDVRLAITRAHDRETQ